MVIFEEKEEMFEDDNNIEIDSHYGICKNQDAPENIKWFIWLKSTGGSKSDKNKQHRQGCDLLLKRLEILGINKVDVYERKGKGRLGWDKKFDVELRMSECNIKEVKKNKHSAGSPLVLGSDNFDYQILVDIGKSREITPNDIEKKYGIPKRLARQIYVRRGQPKFRKELLEKYDNKCAITGCNIEAILEAAHIVPFAKCYGDPQKKYDPSNGILLRADIHTLFDLNLIEIEYTDNNNKFIIKINKTIKDDLCHKELYGQNEKYIHMPCFDDKEMELFKENLQIRKKNYRNYI